MVGGKVIVALILAAAASVTSGAPTVEALYQTGAGNDLRKLRDHVEQLARLAEDEIKTRGLEAALKRFRSPPWTRRANGLHLWGVTTGGVSWFDAGHPEVEGLDVAEMSDMDGRNWAQLALSSADGSGDKVFEIRFPHPTLKTAATGLHSCFFVAKGGERVLCAGAFLDGE